ncbi:hypothetical protein ANCCEY_12414 [Ancylostoma ceylanicum]|uniref:Adt-1/2-like domain-containing protein n=1 Tax=Ancylostoma ceylanicum TaxID=53326 RepID=A0A0D6LF05_9BILA|nr:hypothetical protein ANCCEY_12414 [Ancylostoma ceylanicum]
MKGTDRPCRVWCHLIGSELIRNKGQFPDGTPCGPNQFCISGTCLRLGCDNRAVVASEDDCPNLNSPTGWSQLGRCVANLADQMVVSLGNEVAIFLVHVQTASVKQKNKDPAFHLHRIVTKSVNGEIGVHVVANVEKESKAGRGFV